MFVVFHVCGFAAGVPLLGAHDVIHTNKSRAYKVVCGYTSLQHSVWHITATSVAVAISCVTILDPHRSLLSNRSHCSDAQYFYCRTAIAHRGY